MPKNDTQSMLSRYHRAAALDHETVFESMVLNSQVFPRWIDDSNCFWYARKQRKSKGSSETSKEFRLVDAKAATNREAFDHGALAQALAHASGQVVDADDLPISDLALSLSPLQITFSAFNQRWMFDDTQATCEAVTLEPPKPLPSGGVLSPDGTSRAR